MNSSTTLQAVEAAKADEQILSHRASKVEHAVVRIEALTETARAIGERLFGPRPESVNESGSSKPQAAGAIADLDRQIERLSEATDDLNRALQRLQSL